MSPSCRVLLWVPVLALIPSGCSNDCGSSWTSLEETADVQIWMGGRQIADLPSTGEWLVHDGQIDRSRPLSVQAFLSASASTGDVTISGDLSALGAMFVDKVIADLDGTELAVGQVFTGGGVVRYSHAIPGQLTPQDLAPTFTFRVEEYGKPGLPADLGQENWDTPPFLVVSFSALDPADPDNTMLQGTASFSLQHRTVHQSCCQNLFGCD